jgi:plasmid stability protein
MATLTVRNLDDDLVRKLRIRAAEHGRSAEAEHREILRQVLGEGPGEPNRREIAQRLAAFQREIGGRTAGSSSDLLAQVRDERTRHLTDGGSGS